MKKTILITILLILITTFTLGCTNASSDLLVGGDFEYDDTAGLSSEWKLASGGTENSSVFTVSNGALGINTSTAGWGYASQEVNLKSNSYYKVTYTFSISTFTYYGDRLNFDGLYIGFLEDKSFNIGETQEGVIKPLVHNSTTNADVTADFYFKTRFITSASLAIFVGTEANPVTANVKIKDIALERVKKSDVTVTNDPETGKDVITAYTLDTSVYGANTEKNIVVIVLGGVFTLLAGYAFYMLFRRNSHLEDEYKNKFLIRLRDSKYLGLGLVIVLALFVRFLISILATALAAGADTFYLGYNVEAEAAQAQFIGNFGTVFLKTKLIDYTTKYSFAYSAVQPTPMHLYLLGIVGLISKLFKGGIVLTTFIIKVFAIAADIGVIVIIYNLLQNRMGRVSSLIMSSLYAILPVVFCISAGWGLSESITVFLVMLTLYFILKNNYWGVAISYFIAFCFSLNAIYMLPIVIFYTINQFITRKNLRLAIILSTIIGFGLFYAITVPFNLLDIQGGKAFAAVTDYYNALFVGNSVYTANAFNFQAVLKNNFQTVTTESLFITILFDVFVVALVGAGYFKNKNRMELLLLGSLFVAMLFTFTNKMNPVSMYMALPLMFVYGAMNKEKRVFLVSIAYAALMFVNASYIYMVVGYSARGIEHLGYENAMMYVFGVLNILVTCYFIYVVYDIVASRKAVRIKPLEITYMSSVKRTGRKINKGFQKIKSKFSVR